MYYSYAITIKASFRYMILLVLDYDKSYNKECYCPVVIVAVSMWLQRLTPNIVAYIPPYFYNLVILNIVHDTSLGTSLRPNYTENCPLDSQGGGVPHSCTFLFYESSLSDAAVGGILLVLSLGVLCGALIMVVKILNALLKGVPNLKLNHIIQLKIYFNFFRFKKIKVCQAWRNALLSRYEIFFRYNLKKTVKIYFFQKLHMFQRIWNQKK